MAGDSNSLLSFPTSSLPTPFLFSFPLPTPARHSPPPHPGPRPLLSIHSPYQPYQQPSACPNHRRTYHPQTSYRSQSYSFPPSNPPSPFLLPIAASRRKRAPAPVPAHSIRSKKIKLAHPFFRSSRLFYPLDCPLGGFLRKLQTSSCPSLLPSPSDRIMESPKWLHTSPAAQGHSSRLCPREAQFTGTAQNWSISPHFKPSSFSPALDLPSQQSPSPRSSSSPTPPRITRSIPPPVSHAAPLKAQLLAVLRMRSSLPPGEAALRLKKWVIWNSWVRGQAQRRFYPITSPSCDSMMTTSHASNLADLPGKEWTGDEMFDENGDLVCEEEDLDGGEEIEENFYSTPLAIAKIDLINLGNSEETTIGHGISRSKVPPRIDTSKYPSNLTPPSSPESQRNHGDENKLENPRPNSMVDASDQLSEVKAPKVDQKPLTPPPSPPNQTRK